MKQPIKKKKEKITHIKGTGEGIDTCNECPFLIYENGLAICNASDVILGKEKVINVPRWCGNKKKDEKRI